jgi:hypothetical protein
MDQYHLSIQGGIPSEFSGDIVLVKNGFDWTFHNTGLTVNAWLRIDVQHLRSDVKAFHRANSRTSHIFATNAFARNNMSHLALQLE